jgi:cell division protein FtsZ
MTAHAYNAPFLGPGRRSSVGRAAAAQQQLVMQGAASPCVIKVVGVGGGGGNAVNRMIQFGATDSTAVEYWAINTDVQALDASLSPNRLGLGAGTSRGLGAGGSPDMGQASAEESYDQISQMVSDSDMVFVVAGMGGGTGTGAAPVVAAAAKAAGCLTVGVVTKPFLFEGQRRMRQAETGIRELQRHVDAIIVVSNDKLLDLVEEGTPLQEAFCVADDILRQGVVGIADIIVKAGMINVDFADVQSVMGASGLALMGIGTADGKNRAHDAAVAAVSSPLIDFPIGQATGIVLTITGATDMTLQEVNAAAQAIYDLADPDANIIFGAQVDDSMGGVISVTVVATGFGFEDQL